MISSSARRANEMNRFKKYNYNLLHKFHAENKTRYCETLAIYNMLCGATHAKKQSESFAALGIIGSSYRCNGTRVPEAQVKAAKHARRNTITRKVPGMALRIVTLHKGLQMGRPIFFHARHNFRAKSKLEMGTYFSIPFYSSYFK
jgi:hypothetical protein